MVRTSVAGGLCGRIKGDGDDRTRTDSPKTCDAKDLEEGRSSDGEKRGADPPADSVASDHGLQRILDAWPNLDDDTRRRLLAIVDERNGDTAGLGGRPRSRCVDGLGEHSTPMTRRLRLRSGVWKYGTPKKVWDSYAVTPGSLPRPPVIAGGPGTVNPPEMRDFSVSKWAPLPDSVRAQPANCEGQRPA